MCIDRERRKDSPQASSEIWTEGVPPVKSKNDSNAKFLPDPHKIREAIVELASDSKRLDVAVAFIRPEWKSLLGNYLGTIRVICWLGNSATDPYAVESMRMQEGLLVKQREGLHTKVYLVPGVGSIVGSANLSSSALGSRVGHPQDEAAVLVTDQLLVKEIGNWFEALWKHSETKEISDADLAKAKEDFKKWPIPKVNTINSIPLLPDPMPEAITNLANRVRGLDLMDANRKYRNQINEMVAKKKLNRSDIVKLADLIASWTGHRGVYKTFETQPPTTILQGLRTLLDKHRVSKKGFKQSRSIHFYRDLQIPSMSLLLYWNRPDAYPPFNGKTERFLKDFKLTSTGMSGSSPVCYSTWLAFTVQLSSRLGLPWQGYIDRMVSLHYNSVKA